MNAIPVVVAGFVLIALSYSSFMRAKSDTKEQA